VIRLTAGCYGHPASQVDARRLAPTLCLSGIHASKTTRHSPSFHRPRCPRARSSLGKSPRSPPAARRGTRQCQEMIIGHRIIDNAAGRARPPSTRAPSPTRARRPAHRARTGAKLFGLPPAQRFEANGQLGPMESPSANGHETTRFLAAGYSHRPTTPSLAGPWRSSAPANGADLRRASQVASKSREPVAASVCIAFTKDHVAHLAPSVDAGRRALGLETERIYQAVQTGRATSDSSPSNPERAIAIGKPMRRLTSPSSPSRPWTGP